MITYLSKKRLGKSEQSAAWRLISTCSRHDRTEEQIDITSHEAFSYFDTIDLYHMAYAGKQLVGFVSLFTPTPGEAELAGFVHPRYRKRGIFTQLTERAGCQLQLYAVPAMVYVCNRDSQAGRAVMGHRACRLRDTEHFMEQSPEKQIPISEVACRKAGTEERELLIDINCSVFDEEHIIAEKMVANLLASGATAYLLVYKGSIIGMGCSSVSRRSRAVFLFGFGLLPRFRGSGLGRSAFNALLLAIRQSSAKPITLEVSSSNGAALKLYRESGFRTIATYDYFLSLEP